MMSDETLALGQLPLDLPHRHALGAGDFYVSPANETAVAWIDRWPDWPARALVLVGAAGCGKTHLGHVWQQKSGAVWVTAADLAATQPVVTGQVHLVIEDAERSLPDPTIEEAMLHAFNWIREQGGSLLLTARTPPARWPVGLADLGSRVKALPVASISTPDDALLGALMIKLLSDRQLRVSSDVVLYVLGRVNRSFAAVARLVDALDRASLSQRRNITVPFARDVINLMESS